MARGIEAFELTDLGTQDCEGVPLLVKQITGPIDSVRGDGACDRFACYEEAERRNFRLISPPQRKAKLSVERKKKIKADPGAIKKRDEQVKKFVSQDGQSERNRRTIIAAAWLKQRCL